MNQKLDIYLIRHSKPLIAPGICYGQLDCSVSDDYQEQLNKILTYFSDKKVTAIYSSPLIRCQKLADDLAKKLINDRVIYNEIFKEINFGDWEGKRWDDIARDDIDEWNENRLHFQFPSGETPYQFHERVLHGWNDLIESVSVVTAPKTIILVTHSGVICSLLCRHLELPLENVTDLKVEYASITSISL